MEKLYIIGNGFDIHHGLKTRYKDYKAYLKQKDSQIVQDFDKFLEGYDIDEKNNIEDWSKLEEYTKFIYRIDLRQILDDSIDVSETNIEKPSYWHEVPFFCQEHSKWITGLKSYVNEWIKQIDYTDAKIDPELPIDTTATYINFNYTETLQVLYDVPESNVFHIHGKGGAGEIVFGNNCPPDDEIRSSIIQTSDSEDDDLRISQGIDILNSELEKSKCYYKKSNEIILRYRHLFETIDECRELVIMGFSFGPEDLCYIHKIVEKGFNIEKITIYYHSEEVLNPFQIHLCMPLGDKVTVEKVKW